MTHQQFEAIEKSLIGLTAQDKLELVERLVHELRAAAASDRQAPTTSTRSRTEDEFKQHLLKTGLMTSLPTPPDPTTRRTFQPVKIEGEPISETIIRERR